jgi:hypothetical protein
MPRLFDLSNQNKGQGLIMRCAAFLVIIVMGSQMVAATVTSTDGTGVLGTQRSALASFFASTDGPQWSGLCSNGWTWDNQTTCEWFGISCTNDLVTAINLADCGLSGTLSPDLGLLTSLRNFDVSNNAISGTLPGDGLAALTDLQLLYLYGNNFSGTLPALWSSLSNLTDVRLFNNSFTGTLPAAWSALPYLSTLWLSGNRLTGTLPAAFSALTQLTLFDVNRNGNLVGTLPSSWSAITNLGTVGLRGNQFIGTLPVSWGNLSSLSSLQVDDNLLSGSLPNEWGSQLANLWQFTATNNNLTGTLPDSWSQLVFLGSFDVSRNELSGGLPASWPTAMNASMIVDAIDIRWNCIDISTNSTNEEFWTSQLISPQRQGQC